MPTTACSRQVGFCGTLCSQAFHAAWLRAASRPAPRQSPCLVVEFVETNTQVSHEDHTGQAANRSAVTLQNEGSFKC